jgi:type II secretory pathway component GspD/PulD (secretin)
LLNAQELQSLLQAILQSDTNSDHIVSSQEIERLLIRLQSFSMVDTMKMKMVLQNFVGQNTSTTTLYNHLALSQDEDDDEVDFSLGYGDWLFEEA